jgi:hypothetical protein
MDSIGVRGGVFCGGSLDVIENEGAGFLEVEEREGGAEEVRRRLCAHGGRTIPEYLTLSIVNLIVFEWLVLTVENKRIVMDHARPSQPQDPGSKLLTWGTLRVVLIYECGINLAHSVESVEFRKFNEPGPPAGAS